MFMRVCVHSAVLMCTAVYCRTVVYVNVCCSMIVCFVRVDDVCWFYFL